MLRLRIALQLNVNPRPLEPPEVKCIDEAREDFFLSVAKILVALHWKQVQRRQKVPQNHIWTMRFLTFGNFRQGVVTVRSSQIPQEM